LGIDSPERRLPSISSLDYEFLIIEVCQNSPETSGPHRRSNLLISEHPRFNVEAITLQIVVNGRYLWLSASVGGDPEALRVVADYDHIEHRVVNQIREESELSMLVLEQSLMIVGLSNVKVKLSVFHQLVLLIYSFFINFVEVSITHASGGHMGSWHRLVQENLRDRGSVVVFYGHQDIWEAV